MIDWQFIEQLEGFSLVGVVPDAAHSQSGVTVAAGVDLGQLSPDEINHLPEDVQELIRPYLGLRGLKASSFLAFHPLTLTDEQAQSLESISRKTDVDTVAREYDQAPQKSYPDFEHVPDPLQTIIASVAFQYGSLPVRTPHFWASVLSGDIKDIVRHLENFGDHYPTRRKREAAYLQQHLGVRVNE